MIKAFFRTLLDWSAASVSPHCFSLLHLFNHSFLNCLYFFHSTASVLGLLFSNKIYRYLSKKKKFPCMIKKEEERITLGTCKLC